MDKKPMPKPKTMPQATLYSQAFWDALNRDEWIIQQSANGAQFFPKPFSVIDGSPVYWEKANGMGQLIAITTCRVPGPGFEGEVPYTMGIVKLKEGPRVLSQIINPNQQQLHVGMSVVVAFDASREKQKIFIFKPV